MLSNTGSIPSSNNHIIEETQALLAKLRFTYSSSASIEGQYVSIHVDPRQNDDGQTFRVLVTIYAFGQPEINWREYQVCVNHLDSVVSQRYFATLNQRGQAQFPDIWQGEYALELQAITNDPALLVTDARQNKEVEISAKVITDCYLLYKRVLDKELPIVDQLRAANDLIWLAKSPGAYSRPALTVCEEIYQVLSSSNDIEIEFRTQIIRDISALLQNAYDNNELTSIPKTTKLKIQLSTNRFASFDLSNLTFGTTNILDLLDNIENSNNIIEKLSEYLTVKVNSEERQQWCLKMKRVYSQVMSQEF